MSKISSSKKMCKSPMNCIHPKDNHIADIQKVDNSYLSEEESETFPLLSNVHKKFDSHNWERDRSELSIPTGSISNIFASSTTLNQPEFVEMSKVCFDSQSGAKVMDRNARDENVILSGNLITAETKCKDNTFEENNASEIDEGERMMTLNRFCSGLEGSDSRQYPLTSTQKRKLKAFNFDVFNVKHDESDGSLCNDDIHVTQDERNDKLIRKVRCVRVPKDQIQSIIENASNDHSLRKMSEQGNDEHDCVRKSGFHIDKSVYDFVSSENEEVIVDKENRNAMSRFKPENEDVTVDKENRNVMSRFKPVYDSFESDMFSSTMSSSGYELLLPADNTSKDVGNTVDNNNTFVNKAVFLSSGAYPSKLKKRNSTGIFTKSNCISCIKNTVSGILDNLEKENTSLF